MSIEKKSLISTLKTTKKVNAVSSDVNAKPTSVTSKREIGHKRAVGHKREIGHKRAVGHKREIGHRREL